MGGGLAPFTDTLSAVRSTFPGLRDFFRKKSDKHRVLTAPGGFYSGFSVEPQLAFLMCAVLEVTVVLSAACLCFLHQRLQSQPPEPPHRHLSGSGGTPTPHPALTGTCQVSPALENKALPVSGLCLALRPHKAQRIPRRPSHGARSPSRHRPAPPWVAQEQPLTVPSVPRTELHRMCLPCWTPTWKARAGTARCLYAGRRAGLAGRRCTSWRKNFCLKRLMLFEHFFFSLR